MLGSNETTIKEAIKQLLKAYRLEDKMNETRLINSWDKVVGKMIAKHTINLYIKRRKLFVSLDSAALKSELVYSKEKIISMLNDEVGEETIIDVVFT